MRTKKGIDHDCYGIYPVCGGLENKNKRGLDMYMG
jgi:hypothetical protein